MVLKARRSQWMLMSVWWPCKKKKIRVHWCMVSHRAATWSFSSKGPKECCSRWRFAACCVAHWWTLTRRLPVARSHATRIWTQNLEITWTRRTNRKYRKVTQPTYLLNLIAYRQCDTATSHSNIEGTDTTRAPEWCIEESSPGSLLATWGDF